MKRFGKAFQKRVFDGDYFEVSEIYNSEEIYNSTETYNSIKLKLTTTLKLTTAQKIKTTPKLKMKLTMKPSTAKLELKEVKLAYMFNSFHKNFVFTGKS